VPSHSLSGESIFGILQTEATHSSGFFLKKATLHALKRDDPNFRKMILRLAQALESPAALRAKGPLHTSLGNAPGADAAGFTEG
jgi:hypothetical protein